MSRRQPRMPILGRNFGGRPKYGTTAYGAQLAAAARQLLDKERTMESTLWTCRYKKCKRRGILVELVNAGLPPYHCSECKRLMVRPYASLDSYGPPLIEYRGAGRDPASARPNGQGMLLLPAHYGGGGKAGGAGQPGSHGGKLWTPPPDDTFSCEPDLKGCPIYEGGKQQPVVRIPVGMFEDWVFLANEFATEWIAYLIGEQTEQELAKGGGTIREMYFPQQRANGGHCDAAEGEIRPGVMAAVHSHVGMGVFFSGEDEKHFNHNVELVVNRRRELEVMCRVRLECGRFSRVKGKGVLIGCERQLDLANQLKAQLTPDHSLASEFSEQGERLPSRDGYQRYDSRSEQQEFQRRFGYEGMVDYMGGE